MGGREEGKAVQKVLIVDFDALGESGVRVSRDDQADQHAVDVHLMTVRGRASAQATAVGEARINGGVESDDVTSGAIGGIGIEHVVMRDAVREHLRHGQLQRNREDVEAGEDVFRRGAASAGNSAEVVRVQIDEVEDAFFVKLVWVVELAGDDAPAI